MPERDQHFKKLQPKQKTIKFQCLATKSLTYWEENAPFTSMECCPQGVAIYKNVKYMDIYRYFFKPM